MIRAIALTLLVGLALPGAADDTPVLDAATAAQLGIAPEAGGSGWTAGTYSYDGSGNVTAIGTETKYIYDVLGRLREATVGRGSGSTEHREYTYDPYGNRTSTIVAGSTISTATTPATNHLTGLSAVYDAAGNLTQLQPPGQSTRYEYKYDALGALQEVKAANITGTPTQLHIYTADEERLWTFDLATNSSHWKIRDLDGKVLRDYSVSNTNWTVARDYVYRDGQLLAAVTPTGTLHFSLDHLGTPRVISDAARNRIGFHHYLPFGEEWTDQSGAQEGEPMKFTGHERDADGLDYMHARYYSANLGRFLSVDPVLDMKEALDDPQLWNRYTYVTNNPLKFTDPDGRYRDFYTGPGADEREIGDWSKSPAVSWAFYAQGGLLLGAPAAKGGLVALGTLGRAAFTTFPRLFLAMMGIGNAMTSGPSGPSVNLGSGGRPIAGAVNVDNMGPGFQGTMRQIQVAGDAIALPFKNGSVGNVTAQNVPSVLLGQGGQKFAGELARTMRSGSTLRITTQTPGALKHFAELLGRTYKDIIIKDNVLTAVKK